MPTELKLAREDMISAALRFRPATKRDGVVFLDEGQLSIALVADGVVFRFPRSDFARLRLDREVALLSRIRPEIGQDVPDIVGVDLEAPLGRAFVAHRALPGSVVRPDRLATFDRRTVQRIAEAVATFLETMHRLAPLVTDVLPEVTNEGFAQVLRRELERWLIPRMSAAQRNRATAELDRLAEVPRHAHVLAHTDLGGNVLYDDDTARVGFIDFGSAMVADPVLDAASLSVLGLDLMSQCARTYSLLADLVEGSAVVAATFHLQDALYGARQGDWSYVDQVLSGY